VQDRWIMNKQEKDFLKEHILKLVADNKKGLYCEVIIDYLDYVNKVSYTQDEIQPILDTLIEEKKILEKASLFFPT
jgi:hypothetical protein